MTGSDSAAGTSTSTAWQTLSAVNSRTFGAGDRILRMQPRRRRLLQVLADGVGLREREAVMQDRRHLGARIDLQELRAARLLLVEGQALCLVRDALVLQGQPDLPGEG